MEMNSNLIKIYKSGEFICVVDPFSSASKFHNEGMKYATQKNSRRYLKEEIFTKYCRDLFPDDNLAFNKQVRECHDRLIGNLDIGEFKNALDTYVEKRKLEIDSTKKVVQQPSVGPAVVKEEKKENTDDIKNYIREQFAQHNSAMPFELAELQAEVRQNRILIEKLLRIVEKEKKPPCSNFVDIDVCMKKETRDMRDERLREVFGDDGCQSDDDTSLDSCELDNEELVFKKTCEEIIRIGKKMNANPIENKITIVDLYKDKLDSSEVEEFSKKFAPTLCKLAKIPLRVCIPKHDKDQTVYLEDKKHFGPDHRHQVKTDLFSKEVKYIRMNYQRMNKLVNRAYKMDKLAVEKSKKLACIN